MIQDLPNNLMVGNEADNFHLTATGWTAQRVDLIDFLDTIAPLL